MWNEAADYAINPVLTEAGFVLPGTPLLDPQYRGMTAEQIYEALKEARDGAHGGSIRRVTRPKPADSTAEGGGDDAQDERADDNPDADERPGAVLDAPDPAQQEAEWQVALKQASQAAQMMGQLPGGIALAIEEVMRPRVDWRGILRRFVQHSADRGLLLANAEPPVHRRGLVPAGASFGGDTCHRRCRRFFRLDAGGPPDIQGRTAIHRR